MNAGVGGARYGEGRPLPSLGKGRAGFLEEEYVHGDLMEEKRPEQKEGAAFARARSKRTQLVK